MPRFVIALPARRHRSHAVADRAPVTLRAVARQILAFCARGPRIEGCPVPPTRASACSSPASWTCTARPSASPPSSCWSRPAATSRCRAPDLLRPARLQQRRPRHHARLGRQILDAFGGFDYVVVPSGSCGGMIATTCRTCSTTTRTCAPRADALAARTYELVQLPHRRDGRGRASTRATTAPRPTTTAARACASWASRRSRAPAARACAGLPSPRWRSRRSAAASAAPSASSTPTSRPAWCRDKTPDIVASGADTLLAGDLGCLLNMAGRLSREGSAVQVRHVAEVLAGRHRRAAADRRNRPGRAEGARMLEHARPSSRPTRSARWPIPGSRRR